MPAGAKICDQCGTVREAKSAVEIIDGELVELGSGKGGDWSPNAADKRKFLGELKHIAVERGYSSGWAAHKFREKFGAWPNDPWTRSAEPTPPSLKTKQWVRSRQIAFAKGKGRRANG